MKKLIFATAFFALFGAGLYLSGVVMPKDQQLSDIQLANLEALTNNEGPILCLGMCQEWDDKGGGGIACDCQRHGGKCKKYCS